MNRYFAAGMAAFLLISASGCGKKAADPDQLNPEKPVTVTVWNYYNGGQLTAFEKLAEEFNATVGAEKGIVVVSVSQGDISTLADSLLDAVNGKAGASAPPTLASVYAETAFILNEKETLSPLDPYFSQEELESYIPEFLDEGRFGANGELLLFPILKSTEIFAANATDWQAFDQATGISLDSIQTREDLTAAAQAYYEWTDSLTPDVPEDGKALYGLDSNANYLYIGCCQLGHEMFHVEDGKVVPDLDRDTFKTLWDHYYIPYINGYFGSYANFRSEDAKTGRILALTSSTSGVYYLPDKVTMADDSTHPIQMELRPSLPFAHAEKNAVVQQGASYCLLKSSPAEQAGAVEFIKWFTQPERNLDFARMSGYSPVTRQANTPQALAAAYEQDGETDQNPWVQEALLISAQQFSSQSAYASRPFKGSKDIRNLMENVLSQTAVADRAEVLRSMEQGLSRQEATAPFSTAEYFDAWFEEMERQVTQLLSQ